MVAAAASWARASPSLTPRGDGLQAGQVGEIWVAGPSVARGYWGRPAETEETFAAYKSDSGDGPFLRTGDLGFVQDGELFITGRLKDMIIIRGLNHYPQDIEATAERSHPALRGCSGAAFSVDAGGEERLVFVHELKRSELRSADTGLVIRAIREAVAHDHDLTTHAVLLLRPASVPKTTSGKIQRHVCRSSYLANSLQVVAAWREDEIGGEPPRGELGGDVAPWESGPPGGRSVEAVEAWLKLLLAEWLKIPPSSIDPLEPFVRFGLDSAAAVRISGELQARLARKLSPALMYDYPSIRSLATHLAGEPRHGSEMPAHTQPRPPGESIAVVGIGCRLPGARNPAEYWRLLRDGVDAVSDPAASRRVNVAGIPGEGVPSRGGFLEQVDLFDADFFSISGGEAEVMDPQQRLLLEVAWEAIEDAGQAQPRAAGSVSSSESATTDYAHLPRGPPPGSDRFAGMGNATEHRRQPDLLLPRPARAKPGLWTPPARRRWSPSHLACQSLRPANASWHWSAGSICCSAPDAFRRVQPRWDAVAGRPLQDIRRGGRRLRPRRGVRRRGAQAVLATPLATETASWL